MAFSPSRICMVGIETMLIIFLCCLLQPISSLGNCNLMSTTRIRTADGVRILTLRAVQRIDPILAQRGDRFSGSIIGWKMLLYMMCFMVFSLLFFWTHGTVLLHCGWRTVHHELLLLWLGVRVGQRLASTLPCKAVQTVFHFVFLHRTRMIATCCSLPVTWWFYGLEISWLDISWW